MNIRHAVLTDSGPRAVNEDAADCWRSGSTTIACVADGLGGMGGGDVASQLAMRTFRASLDNTPPLEESLLDAAWEAHRAIRAAQLSGDGTTRMATTLTAIAITYGKLIGVHCGDSRAAIARGKGIKKLTVDHSEGQRLFEAGKLTKEELLNYQRKHILESALGEKGEPRIDKFSFDLSPGDRLFLTTDGVHNIVLLRELQRLASASNDPNDLVESVADTVQERGPTDNYSIVALYVD
ncbi:serine/threonine-protein phosphatase [Rhizobium sp. WL3]|uniref:PP2C family protein-serine/threonine phosphatase n=1 Tax=Rhizobium sp. WL3 TaxID=2603277 RepID=UPI0011C20343|nr:PP2C family serine/threonine-protein phosphatase [Rhizobium sp. WL3]QEE44309.1 serine/threonine-protein phosphatase [Rhizobium sp. WL3]